MQHSLLQHWPIPIEGFQTSVEGFTAAGVENVA